MTLGHAVGLVGAGPGDYQIDKQVLGQHFGAMGCADANRGGKNPATH